MTMFNKLNRRTFVKGLSIGAGLGALGSCQSSPVKKSAEVLEKLYTEDALRGINPMDRRVGKQEAFSGDNPTRAHQVLWDKEGFFEKRGGIPSPKENVPVVIVGGGISGLFTAYLLRDLKPIILESSSRLGGNSRGESWQGIDYSIGAAYFGEQRHGSPINQLFKEIGVFEKAVTREGADPVIFGNKILDSFWEGGTAPESEEYFRKAAAYFQDVGSNRNGRAYPNIPAANAEDQKILNQLNQRSLLEQVEYELKEPVHPHLETLLEHYCWSTFACSAREVNAATGLYAFAAEFGKMHAVPGGNGGISELLVQKLADEIPISHLRTDSVVADVQVEEDGCRVTYVNAKGELKSIRAQAVVMACPKFVVKRLIDDLEPERKEVISQMKYRSYLVANALIDAPFKKEFYDLYLLADGRIDSDIEKTAKRHMTTDMVLANYTSPHPNKCVLTLYRALPFERGRSEILSGDSYEKFKKEFKEQLVSQLFPVLGVKASALHELRLARWGHPMPIPAKNCFSQNWPEILRTPYREKVFFVQQDNWLTSAIEVCAQEALHFVPLIRKAIVSV